MFGDREQLIGAGEVTQLDELFGEGDADEAVQRVLHRRERQGALEQAARSDDVGPIGGAAAGGVQMHGGRPAELGVNRAAELPFLPHRLLQMPARDLIDLREVEGGVLQPVRIALVEIGALGDRDALVGSVANEQVAKSVGDIARDVCHMGPDQILANEQCEPALDVGIGPLACECLDRCAMEHLTLDRAALEQITLVSAQPLEPGREQRLDGRRNLDRAALAREPDHLLEKQRVALARADNTGPHRRR